MTQRTGRPPALFFAIGGILSWQLAAGGRPESGAALLRVQAPKELQGVFGGLFGSFSAPLEAGVDLGVWVPHDGNEQGCAPFLDASDGAALPPSSVAVVRRGKCTFAEKTRLAREARARGIIITSDTEDIIQMNDNETSDAGIFALSVKQSVGEKFISWTSEHRSDSPVLIKFEYYFPARFDISEACVVLLATLLVVAGAHFSTSDLRVGSPLAPKREEVLEVNTEIALGWCALGSVMLVVLFFFMRYMIYFIIFSFCIGGASCIVQFTSSCLQYYVPALRQRALNIPAIGPVCRADLASLVPAVLLVGGWLHYRNTPHGWLFQDIIGAGVLCMIQRTLQLPNIKVASVLLSAMFFFDIFWVFLSPLIFTTSVMVEVAKGGGTKESVPMLLRIPAIGDPLGSDRMLGFGDVALPGLLVSYLLRHDILTMPRKRFLDGYFFPSVVGYFAGLVVTIGALVFMQMGQPALLYLVPGTLGTTLVLGWRRGEFQHLWEGTPNGLASDRVNGDSKAATVGADSMEVGNVTEDAL